MPDIILVSNNPSGPYSPGPPSTAPVFTIDSDTGQIKKDGVPLAGGGVFTKRVIAAQADLQNMKATPVVIVPGVPGLITQSLAGCVEYDPVSVDYALGDASNLYIGSRVNPINSLNVLSKISASILAGANGPGNALAMFPAINAAVGTRSQFESQDLVLTHDGTAELTQGDGNAIITVTYVLVQLS